MRGISTPRLLQKRSKGWQGLGGLSRGWIRPPQYFSLRLPCWDGGAAVKKLMIVGLLVLAGCGPRMSIADRCTSYGFAYGTNAHANCQMRLSAHNDVVQQRQGDALIRMGTQMMQQPAYQPPATTMYRMPSGNTMSCTRIGNMVSCI